MKNMNEAAKAIAGLVILIGLGTASLIGIGKLCQFGGDVIGKVVKAGKEKAGEISGQVAPKVRELADWLEKQGPQMQPPQIPFSRWNASPFESQSASALPTRLLGSRNAELPWLNSKDAVSLHAKPSLFNANSLRAGRADGPPQTGSLSQRLAERLNNGPPRQQSNVPPASSPQNPSQK